MRGNKNKGIVKVLGIGLTAAGIIVYPDGVAENAVTGAVSGKSVSDGLRQLTALSVMLAVPVNEFDGRDEDTVSSEPCTEKPYNETKTEKQEQQEQKVPATDNPSSSTQDTSGETLVPVDAPADAKTRLISVNIRKDKDDLTQYTAKDGTVKEKHYGKISGDNVIDLENGQIRNCTKLPSELIGAEAEKKPSVTLSDSNDPQVLIIHTHTTESYERDSDGYYDTDYDGRSLCPANSVVGVGAVLAQTLADNGISTLHDGTVFDDPVYNYSYSRSRERTEQLLKEYPSIKIVLIFTVTE